MRLRQLLVSDPRRALPRLVKIMTGQADLDLLRSFGVTVPDSAMVTAGAYIDPAFGFAITIGERVTLAPGVMILAHDAAGRHPGGRTRVAAVVIKDGAYIGARTVILPGVTVGAGAIVGAGSVVSTDVPDGALAVGVPARVVGTAAELVARRGAKVTAANLETNFMALSGGPDGERYRARMKAKLAEQGELWV